MLVFRDLGSSVNGDDVRRELERLCHAEHGNLLEALLAAADVECALEDAKHPGAPRASELNDALAEAWLDGKGAGMSRVLHLLGELTVPSELRIRRPEGFAFYALDPSAYARAALHVVSGRRPVCVVGVRTIGTSLSAIVRARLVLAGLMAHRFTVRPGGHPWDRRLALDARESERVRLVAHDADFVIVDEGPGQSGSTFLAVGEALRTLGVRAERILFLASHPIVPERLCARDAVRRFAPFSTRSVAGWSPPAGAVDFSGGAWRAHARLGTWPPSWRLQERAKYFEPTSRSLCKFSGFAAYGRAVSERVGLLADAGYGPRATLAEPGFLGYRWIDGRPARARRDARRALSFMAEYAAFRARELSAGVTRPRELEAMTALNVHEGLGVHLPPSFELQVRTPVVADGRMLPHEFLLTDAGALLKTDGAEHGDDHFFPGPVDIAWDVAGATIEWDLDQVAKMALCTAFERASGDRVLHRLPAYEIAYGAFRLGIATFAMRDSGDDEAERWRHARRYYRHRLRRSLDELGVCAQRSASP